MNFNYNYTGRRALPLQRPPKPPEKEPEVPKDNTIPNDNSVSSVPPKPPIVKDNTLDAHARFNRYLINMGDITFNTIEIIDKAAKIDEPEKTDGTETVDDSDEKSKPTAPEIVGLINKFNGCSQLAELNSIPEEEQAAFIEQAKLKIVNEFAKQFGLDNEHQKSILEILNSSDSLGTKLESILKLLYGEDVPSVDETEKTDGTETVDDSDEKSKPTADEVQSFYFECIGIQDKLLKISEDCKSISDEEAKLAIIDDFLSSNNIQSVSAEELLKVINGMNSEDPIEKDFWTFSDALNNKILNEKVDNFAKQFDLDTEIVEKLKKALRNGASITEIGEILGFNGIDALFAFFAD